MAGAVRYDCFAFQDVCRILGPSVTGEGSGRIFMADCGASAYEEINQILPGMNYGWSGREGIDCYKLELCGNTGRDPDGVRQFLSGCYKMELCGNIGSN